MKNKIVAVTGSSSGIGQAIAIECAKAGAHIIVHGSRNQTGAKSVADSITELGREAHVELIDVSKTAHHQDFIDRCWAWRNRIDVWINNAGADVLTGEATQLTYHEKLQRLWEVDVLGTIGLSNLVGAKMKTHGGTIINIGWDQAEIGMSGSSGEIFATTKGAIMAYSRSLARSLAPYVRVNCVAPGWIKTAWGNTASDYWQERAKKESLLERWGEPEDVAKVVRFLASDDAKFVTGQIYAVNGGYRGESKS